MAHYFFDTSALVKRHVIETGSPWVKLCQYASIPAGSSVRMECTVLNANTFTLTMSDHYNSIISNERQAGGQTMTAGC
jgi:hypothetical protein